MPDAAKAASLLPNEITLLHHFRLCNPRRQQLLSDLAAELCRAAPEIEIFVVSGDKTKNHH